MSFEDRLEQGTAPAWRPDQGDDDLLVGTVVDIDRGTSDYEPYPLLTIIKEDGTEVAVHAFHTVLKNELIRQQPQLGERIGIKYLGEQQTKPGSRFKSFIGYRVKVDRAAGEFDWSKIGAAPDPTDVNPAYDPEPDGLKAAAKVTVPETDDSDIPFS